MAIRFLCGLSAAAVAATVAWVAPATAQDAPRTQSATIPEAMEEIFFGNSGTYFYNRTAWRQANYILGFGGFDSASFPEREIEWDADALHRAYVFLMNEQNTSTPIIRVPDLYSPYNTSVQLLPASQLGSRVSGSEFVFERAPFP
ncbi:hypothetical protein [Leptolyngbya sp. PCC 6406]|uniref:hypothetical protein n=1 Tax=Leptolyngbya sp. PCC 6406 TaxID=1173264 RepID=UPI0002ACEE41|nr:hypothetical protein [Leptolyngbya sp. PCC 6406]